MTLDSLFDRAPKGQMKAVRITERHDVFVADVPVPVAGEGEIVVRPTACGICGTDLHILHHGFPGTNYPVTPGHEFAGYVASVGPGVSGLREGDFVAVDPNVSCGSCRWCLAGRPNLCPHLMPIGVGRDGAAAELVAVPAHVAYKVREDLGGPLAALIEPLACCLHAIESSQGVKDRDILVLGGGTMGLLIAIAAELAGAGRVTVADPSSAKLAIARQAGITQTTTPADLGDDAFEVVFEAAGVRAALEQAFRLVEKTGVLVQVGVHDADATVPIIPFKVYERELRIIGSNSLANKFPRAVDVMMDIRERAAALIGPSYLAFDFPRAIEAMSLGDTVKTQLHFE